MKLLLDYRSKVGITGFRGFIGQKFIETYFNEYNFIETELEGISDSINLIHLASRVGKNDSASALLNVSMDLDVFNFCQHSNSRLIYASGNNVYEKKLDCDVYDKLFCDDWYSWSKVSSEFALSLESYNFPSRVLRIADVFGAKQRHGNFFKGIEGSINSSSIFNFNPKINKLRTYIMVDDLIEVLNFLCKSNWVGKEIYNIGYKTPYSLDEIIETLASLGMGVELNIEKSKMLDFDRRSMKQSDIPGYSYKLDMPEALKLYYKQINKSE